MNTKTDKKQGQHETPQGADEGKNLPANAQSTALTQYDFGDDAGKGLENVSSSERLIPFFRILQTNNPQCKDPRNGGMPGAAPGKILNLGTGELFDGIDGIPFIPVYRDHNYTEWTPRDAGGGFVGIRAADNPLILELRAKHGQFGKLPHNVTKRNEQGQALDGTEFVEGYYLYGMFGADRTPGLIAFTSTQIRTYKAFLNRTTNFKYRTANGDVVPPLWAHEWLLQTTPQKNKKGEFYGWRLTLKAKDDQGAELPYIKSFIPRNIEDKPNPLYVAGKEFHDSIAQGKAAANFNQAGNADEADEEVPM